MWGLVCFLSMVTGAINHLFPPEQGVQSQQGHKVTAAEGTSSWNVVPRDGLCVRQECILSMSLSPDSSYTWSLLL